MGDAVFVKNFGPGRKWLPGKVTKVTGPVSYQVKLEDGRQRRCHVDQLRIRVVAPDSVPEVPEPGPVEDLGIPSPELEEETPTPQPEPQPNPPSPVPHTPPTPDPPATATPARNRLERSYPT